MIEDKPFIVEETPSWAVVRKPHGMPSAPLREGEDGTLVAWFVRERPEADSVRGRKPVERGIVHRLDTATGGLVLFAKTQGAHDALLAAQNEDLIVKAYVAYCSRSGDAPACPLTVTSRFRAYGPGRKEVRPLFPGMRGYDEAGRDYATTVERAEEKERGVWSMTCVIARGYRHQIRAHLAWLGFPIIGDALYGPAQGGEAQSNVVQPAVPAVPARLELHAVSISFPDPDSGSTVSVSLPPPDRTSP